MSKEPLHIRPVANGFIVTTRPEMGMMVSDGGTHVFTDPASLGKWVAEYYTEPKPVDLSGSMPVPAEEASECDDPDHNPDHLTDEQIGRKDGWRLLRKSEVGHALDEKNMEYWDGEGWDKPVPDFSQASAYDTYRTKLSPAELAKLT